MNRKEKLGCNILDATESKVTLSCTKCKETMTLFNIDSFDAVDIFIQNEWYATDTNVYCPKCNKKRKSK